MKTVLCAAAFALVAAVGASPAATQLTAGAWTGTMTPPGGQPFNVSYEVGQVDGALAIVMRSVLVQEIIPFHDVRLDGDALTFWWEPGVRVDCRLVRTPSGSFEGACGEGSMTMVPPAGGA